MKASELCGKSVDELQKVLLEQRELQFKQRMQKATGQLEGAHELKQVRRNIARIKTVLNDIDKGVENNRAEN